MVFEDSTISDRRADLWDEVYAYFKSKIDNDLAQGKLEKTDVYLNLLLFEVRQVINKIRADGHLTGPRMDDLMNNEEDDQAA